MQIKYSKYGRVFDLLPEIILIVDRQYRIVDHNRAAKETLRLSGDRLEGAPVLEIIPESHRGAMRSFLTDGRDGSTTETQFMRDGEAVPMDVSVNLKILKSSDTYYHVLIAKDITEQKKKELDLLRFSNVIHYTINPIQITDANGVMVYVNPAFERSSGYTREELIGRNPKILSSGKHGKKFWQDVWSQILSGRIWTGEVENRRKDGSPLFTELVISPIIDAQGKVVGFLGAHRDITEQKMLEKQLIRSQKMEAIGTLAAGIAHEVGNPLTSISSLVQVIQRTTHDDFAIEKLELIKNQVNRIARIIRELVDFSRPSTFVVKPTDVNQVVRDALNIVQYGKKVRTITFEISLDEHLPKMNVVPDQLVQVFINILMNAVDALEGQPGTIIITSCVNQKNVEVVITDTGKGIPPEDREKIFEPFYTTKEVGQGTGLGLWVSYGIVKNFGGEITVESVPGSGSTFRVSLPIKGD